eukprot:scpid7000/ scgid19742/ Probable cation-transporting ATPase 13A3
MASKTEKTGSKQQEEVLDDDERELECSSYRTNRCATFFYYVGVIFTLGGLWLLCRWRPAWRVYITCDKAPLNSADQVVFKDKYGDPVTEEVFEEELRADNPSPGTNHEMVVNASSDEHLNLIDAMEPTDSAISEGESSALLYSDEDTLPRRARFLIHHKLRYILDERTQKFVPLKALDCGVACSSIRRRRNGLTPVEYTRQKMMFGSNSMDVEVKPYYKLIIDEALDPFYIFQAFSLLVWVLEVYYVYAGCILVISLISIITDVVEVRRHLTNLRDMVAKPSTVKVMRCGEDVKEVSSLELVPGDILVISSRGLELPCDAALLSGACVVNESMLTGESVPVTKMPLPDLPSPHDPATHPSNQYCPSRHKRHTLFCGTKVIQTRTFDRDFALAIVIRTGFTTAKGSLVRSILFPKPVGFQFFRDALRFVGVLAILAVLGMIYSFVTLFRFGVDTEAAILRALDIVTIAVPPALPAAMTIGMVAAQRRLKKKNIFCISPPRINVCGKLKLFCFDKTGTLTNDGMDLTSIYPTEQSRFVSHVEDCSGLVDHELLLHCMATCHSLNIIDDELVGDPLDLKMFEATKWVFEERSSETRWDPSVMSIVRPADVEPFNLDKGLEGLPGLQLGIMQQYTFSSELQRMSVLVQRLGAARQAHVFCKGAPEMVVSLCDPGTVPNDFAQVLVSLTQKGYRVLACASKALCMPWHTYRNMARVDAEKDLSFLGLLVMCNTLKPETAPIIRELHDADIRTVMVTGDNIQTAVSVARECGMIRSHQKVVMLTAHKAQSDDTATANGDATPGKNGGGAGQQQAEETPSTAAAVATALPVIQFSAVGEPTDAMSQSLGLPTHGHPGIPSYQNGNSHGCPATDVASLVSPSGVLSTVRLAISGKSFALVRQYYPDLLKRLMLRGSVFARMAPEQKTQLVQEFQSLGYGVGMCGDGANDCGALKAAHAGISLSEAEASIASPFTSKVPNIECVPTLIREGRAALVTSFSVFKFMALYSIIQFVSILILYSFDSNLGDRQYLYIDLILILTFAFVMVRTHAYPHLARRRPPGSLSGIQVLTSLLTQIVIQTAFQAGAFEYLKSQPWFVALQPKDDSDNIVCMENYVVFFMSSYQYIWVALAFSAGRPYRLAFYTNYLFLVSLTVLFGLTTWLLFYPPDKLVTFIQLDPRMQKFWLFNVALLELTLLNLAISVITEFFVLPSTPVVNLLRHMRRKKQPKNAYKLVEREIQADPHWPQLDTGSTGNVAINDPRSTLSSTQHLQQPSRSARAGSTASTNGSRSASLRTVEASC